MLYSCTHMATVGVNGLSPSCSSVFLPILGLSANTNSTPSRNATSKLPENSHSAAQFMASCTGCVMDLQKCGL